MPQTPCGFAVQFLVSWLSLVSIARATNKPPATQATTTTTTTIVMNTQEKIKEGQIQLGKEEHYKTPASPMVVETHLKVKQLVNDLYHGNHID